MLERAIDSAKTLALRVENENDDGDDDDDEKVAS
jgi:hypothetical protein